MANKKAGQLKEISGNIEQAAGARVREKVMEGSEKAGASSDPRKVALWIKGALDRMDALTEPARREQAMLLCGYNCAGINKRPIEAAIARRHKYPTEEAFLSAEIQKPPKGIRLEREGNVLLQYYTPRTYGKGIRCYCSLMRGLPDNVTASPTYCHCSRGFVEKYWEGILGRPVSVELGHTAISGAEECKFIIHL
jgi:hypothetical protein